MQLEPLENIGTNAAMHPPAAAMHQSPESLGTAGNDAATMQQDLGFPENAGEDLEDAGMHLPPELQRVVYQFAGRRSCMRPSSVRRKVLQQWGV